ncbi:MAG TPA: hypothetical protein VMG82_34340 [Candidatus Sulfotelmatobacter sp.]|nr:hypothetical protein [Candidatus Sulfotelmatobacter sp.]
MGQHGDGAENQRLGEAEFENTDQDEQEVDGKRPRDPWQIDFQAGSQNGDAEVADEFGDILTALVDAAIDQRTKASQDDQRDK